MADHFLRMINAYLLNNCMQILIQPSSTYMLTGNDTFSKMIMESEVMESDERQIRIWRNDNEIFSGESYNPLERLRVSVRWVTKYDDVYICFYDS